MDKVDSKNYVELATVTESSNFGVIRDRLLPTERRLLHAAMGMATETGEFMDALKKHVFYGKDLDIRNLREELGDIMWYIAIACDALDVELDTVLAKNIEKLRKRYPEGFKQVDALHRDVDNELNHM